MITQFELGWLVALLEGEGWFDYRSKSQRVGIQMTDEDTILRYASIVERVTGNKPNVMFIQRQHTKDMHHICLGGENARKVMKLVLPHMSDRRRVRIWQSLNKYTPPKKRTLAELGIDLSKLMSESQ